MAWIGAQNINVLGSFIIIPMFTKFRAKELFCLLISSCKQPFL